MGRELAAALLLMLLVLGAWLNVACLDRLVGTLEQELSVSEQLADEGDFAAARQALDRALSRWTRAGTYTEIFLRHPEIDAVEDSFFELRSILTEENAEAYPSAFLKLRYHLDGIDRMEHVRPGSVLFVIFR